MGEEKRHEMMETLFGAESEDSEDEDPEALERPASAYSDDEAEGGGQVEVESEGERVGSDLEKGESEAERAESEAEREESDGEHSYDEGNTGEHSRSERRMGHRQQAQDSDGDHSYDGEGEEAEDDRFGAVDSRRARRPSEDNDADQNYSEDEVDRTSERRITRQQDSVSGSEKSHGHDLEEEEENEVDQYHPGQAVEDDEDEVDQAREASEEGYDGRASGGVAEMRDVFGDSDEDEQEPVARQHSPEQAELSPSDDEGSIQRGIRPEDIVPDEEQPEEQYGSDDEQPAERRAREKPVGSPLHIDLPFCPPLGHPDKMHVVRVSNIMGIESRPFDPKTYIEEEEQFITDESGHKQRIRLEDNVARWRVARSRDGSLSYESNARFVKWSDGSMQLLIGNEVLDISIQKAHQDHAHLFLRQNKGTLQSQGRLLQKMKFMPSSLSSKSHRLLTALVDSRNRKIYKVKNVITNKDPEREKEEAEKLQEQRIRSKEDLQRKQEKISRKYLPVRERVEPQLSPGYLEGALEEDEEADDYGQSHHSRRFQEQLEAEGRAERRIINAKRQSAPLREPKRPKDRRPSLSKRREEQFSEESEQAPSEYESDDQEEDMRMNEVDEEEQPLEEDDGEEQEEEEERGKTRGWDDEEDDHYKKRKDRDDSDNESSPPRKPVQRRRVVVSDSEED